MKILCIRQPWAALIIEGGKDIENWTWPTKYRGPLLIHASSNAVSRQYHPEIEHDYRCKIPLELASMRGGIIGMVDLVDCVTKHRSKWFEGTFGFVLANPRPLPFVPMKGRLNLFEAPADILRRLGVAGSTGNLRQKGTA